MKLIYNNRHRQIPSEFTGKFLPSQVDRLDHPFSRTIAQGLDLMILNQNIARKLSKLLTYVPNRIGEKEEDFRQHQLSHRINIKFIFPQSTSKNG